MRTTRASSTEKVKRWFRKRSRSGNSSSVDSKGLSGTGSSLEAPGSEDTSSLADTDSFVSDGSYANTAPTISPNRATDSAETIVSEAIHDDSTGLKETSLAKNEVNPWKQAADYLNDDDREILERINAHDDSDTTFADLRDSITKKQKISQEKSWKVTFGGRRIVLRDVLAKMVTWLDSFKAIGDLVSQADPVHAGLPWLAIKIVLSVLTTDQEQMGLIVIGMEQVVCLIARCRIYHQLYLEDVVQTSKVQHQAISRLSNAMARLYAKMTSFLAYYIRLLDLNGATRTLKAFCQPGEVSEKLKEIGALETRVTTEANICQGAIGISAFQKIDENSKVARQQLREMATSFDGEMMRLWKHLNEDERCKIIQWVSDIPYESDHYIASKGRVDGTGEWLLSHEVYATWRQSDTSTLLWLNGIPGAGKTKLSSRVIDDLLTTLPTETEKNTGFAYFYCDRNRADHNEPVAIMRSIVRQLCAPRGDHSIESCIEEQYLKRKVKGFSSDRLVAEECKKLLLQLAAGYSSIYIVVDGLDECDRGTRHILMDLLDEMMAKFEQSIKIYIASRTDQDLRKRYHKGTHLEVTANDNQADIEKFVLNKMDQSEFCRNRLSQKLRNKILRTFQDKSQGMFQWATLHIGELLQLERNADIAEYLDGLPRGLEAAYDKIYAQIVNQIGSKRNVAFAAFQIVMVSCRPLHPLELAIAVAQHPSQRFILDRDVDVGYVLDVCQNLLVVTDGSQERAVPVDPVTWPELDGYLAKEVKAIRPSVSTGTWENDFGLTRDSICRFAHLSVQEYLETKHWSSIEAHSFMAGICLRTLLCLTLPDEIEEEQEDIHERDDEESWNDLVILHVSQFEERKVVEIIPPEEEDHQTMLDTSLSTTADTEVIEEVSANEMKATGPRFEPPPFKCYLDWTEPHSHDDNQSCYSQTFEPFLESYEGSPLETWALYCAASISQHLAIVSGHSRQAFTCTIKSLVEKFLGTPSNSASSYRAWARLAQNSLSQGKYSSNDRIRATYNLSNYDNPKAVIRPHTKPAFGCAILGLDEVLDSWLSDGQLDPNECNVQGDSLLHLAALFGHTDTCRILLKHGADPNLPTLSILTPLGLAIGHEEVDLVRLLAENGADLNATITPVGKRPQDWRGSRAPPFYVPILETVMTGKADIVKAIVDAAKSTSYTGQPLHLDGALKEAARECRADLAALLLSYGNNQDWDR
ncbi:ankyrin repeat-containing protein [Fusarium tjaetaba]|uniref:Ankyrin repeat-containing protein n=1 Tax=Fusarium tjaetaba TaxID=1567544 RepID=A0A8H5R1D0_9HYPO|nr:ankyrin repeat-containing protein [Fusarium tjaetaba]KAF5624688.1 ankyrin repeat-containing protein [Fusarium tjaetaba]